jgi:hypothetical protein
MNSPDLIRIAEAVHEVRDDFDVSDMMRLAVNVRHARGSIPRAERRQAAFAIIALKTILEASALLPQDPNQ